MGLKILHSADWHLDSPFAGFAPEQRQLLQQEQLRIPDKIARLCRQEHCDLVLLAGDIFDGPASRQSLQAVQQALAECAVPVFIAPGNHDFAGSDSVWQQPGWPENVHIFTGAMESLALPELDCQVYGAGFQSMDCPALLEGFQAQGQQRWQIAVLHADPTKQDSPYNPVTASQVKRSGLDYLALGHIHKPGAFQSGKTICAWPGCPMGRGWDETGDHGVCLVTLEEKPELQAVSLQLPRFLELTATVTEDPAAAVENCLPAAGTGDFIRLTLLGQGPVDLEALEKQFSAYPHLQFRDKTLPPLDIWGSCDADTLEGIYFRMLRSALAENPERGKTIAMAAEISRKLLEGREVVL